MRCGETHNVDHESPVETTAAGSVARRPVPLWRRLLIGRNVRWTLFRLVVVLTVASVGLQRGQDRFTFNVFQRQPSITGHESTNPRKLRTNERFTQQLVLQDGALQPAQADAP